MKSLPVAIVLLAILVCAASLTAQDYKGSMTYNGPRGMTASPLVLNLTFSGSSITGTLGIGSTGANMPITGTRTGDYCKVTATGAGGGVFTGTCTAASFSGTCTIGSTTGNFSLKAAFTPPPPTPPVPPAPISNPPAKPTPPAPIKANPPIAPVVPSPPPCVSPIVAPPQPSPGAPPPVATNPPHPTPAPVQRPAEPPAPTPAPKPATQPVLYCGTFTNTTFNLTGYLEIRVDPGPSFAGEISVGQAISGASRDTFGSGSFTGFLRGINCGATDSGGLQFNALCTPTSINSGRYSIEGQIGSFSVTTAGCANKK